MLSGVGQAPWDWQEFLAAFGADRPMSAPWLPGLRPGAKDRLSLEAMSAGVLQDAMLTGWPRVDLVGLSLGAMVALDAAAQAPESVRAIVVVAGQAAPPRAVLRAQSFALRFVRPGALPSGLDKARVRELFGALAAVDLTDALPRIAAPTLVVCGAKDKANLPASRLLAERIPGAALEVLPGVGHQVNTQAPQALATLTREFLDGIGPR